MFLVNMTRMASATNFVSYFTPILWFNKLFKELNFKSFHYENFYACLFCCQEGLNSPSN